MDYLSSLLLLCSHVASNFSSYGSSFLFPCHASHGYAVAICSNFLLGLCCHLQVASYLIFHHVIANCCYLSCVCGCAALHLLLMSAAVICCCNLSFACYLAAACIHHQILPVPAGCCYLSPNCPVMSYPSKSLSIQVQLHSSISSKLCSPYIHCQSTNHHFVHWLAESRRFG